MINLNVAELDDAIVDCSQLIQDIPRPVVQQSSLDQSLEKLVVSLDDLVKVFGQLQLPDKLIPGALHDFEGGVVGQLVDEVDHLRGEQVGQVQDWFQLWQRSDHHLVHTSLEDIKHLSKGLNYNDNNKK